MSEHKVTQELYDEIQAYALARYEDGGWDVIVECIDGPGEMYELLHDEYTDRPDPTNLEEAIERLRDVVSVWADRQADARNSAF